MNALDNRSNQKIADITNLSVFSSIDGQLPGDYIVNIYFNNELMEKKLIKFILLSDNQLEPEITKKQLLDWGVKSDSSYSFNKLNEDDMVSNIEKYIPNAKYNYDFNNSILNIYIPQIFINKKIYGYTPPEQWEDGINAGRINYQFNGANSWGSKLKNIDSHFLSLQSTMNLFSWQLKNYSTYSSINKNANWSSHNTYLQRPVVDIKSELIVGEYLTNNQLFDNFQFTGLQLTSDETMQPLSMRGYSPIVKGIAKSNAKLIIKQNNYIIYESFLSAGPFEITDLYPTSSYGNLDVIIEEEDGNNQMFVVPFSSVPGLQRNKRFNYTLTAGKYRPTDLNSTKSNFILGTLNYGLPYNLTLFSGTILSKNYYSGLLGIGLNMGNFGALSFDLTSADSYMKNNSKKHGESYRVQYAKNLINSGTTVSLANYQFTSNNFYSYPDSNSYSKKSLDNKNKSRTQIVINQSLRDYGSLYISGYQQKYWNVNKSDENITIGYNNTYDSISYGLNYSYTNLTNSNSSEKLFSFNVSVPFSFLDNPSRFNVFFNNNKDNANSTMGLNGSFLSNAFNYNVQQSYYKKNPVNTSLSIGYRDYFGYANSGYNYNDFNSRLNYGIQGGMLFHSGGITLTQSLGDTIGLVKIKDIKNVAIQNQSNISTDYFGYAVIPNLIPYQKNNIYLNVSTLNSNVDLSKNSSVVIPKKGSVVFTDFEPIIGYRVLFTITNNNSIIPFGSIASLKQSDKNIAGIVGYNGEVYMSGMTESGEILVKWGDKVNEKCIAKFKITPDDSVSVYKSFIDCI